MLYFSDRNINVGGQQYDDYLLSITSVQQAAARLDGKGQNSSIRIGLKNRPFWVYSKLIEIRADNPITGAEATIKELYLDAAGNQTTIDTVAVGVLDEATNITELSFFHNMSNFDYVADLSHYGGL